MGSGVADGDGADDGVGAGAAGLAGNSKGGNEVGSVKPEGNALGKPDGRPFGKENGGRPKPGSGGGRGALGLPLGAVEP